MVNGDDKTRREIDMSVTNTLMDIRNRQRLVREYRERALQIKDGVDETVYRKVVSDYDARYAELEKQASPLVRRAQAEYQKLHEAWSRVNQTSEQARLAKVELEFRHAVGEIDRAQLAESLKQPERNRAACEEELAALTAQKARFAEVLPELNLEPLAAASENVQGSDNVEEVDTLRLESRAEAPPLPEDRGPLVSPEELTMILQDGILVVDDENMAATFRLSALNSIGRGEDNQVRLVSPGVSQRHALIVAGREGYTLKDCQSRNGTFVNGTRITDHKLEDGDRIRVGDLELTFRIPARPSKHKAP